MQNYKNKNFLTIKQYIGVLCFEFQEFKTFYIEQTTFPYIFVFFFSFHIFINHVQFSRIFIYGYNIMLVDKNRLIDNCIIFQNDQFILKMYPHF